MGKLQYSQENYNSLRQTESVSCEISFLIDSGSDTSTLHSSFIEFLQFREFNLGTEYDNKTQNIIVDLYK